MYGFNINEESEEEISVEEKPPRKKRRVKRKKEEQIISFEKLDIPDVVTVILNSRIQGKLECLVGSDVTAEKPWKYIYKDSLELELSNDEEECGLEEYKNEILEYPQEELLIGYIPDETRDYDEFYLCLTPVAVNKVTDIIERVRQKFEERLNNSILRCARVWKTQGSEDEVNQSIYKNNRPLLEVEVETQYPLKSIKSYYKLRMVEQARDGYAELLSTPGSFSNLFRKRIDASTQVTPTVTLRESQTVCTYPQNTWTQYEYSYETINKLSKEFTININDFINHKLSDIEDLLYVNTYINFYNDDYNRLVKNKMLSIRAGGNVFNEYVSFQDPIVCKGQVISSLTWHPMWTGTVAIAYSVEAPTIYFRSKPSYDEVHRAVFEITPVLLWSLNDNLQPKLFLETPREITALSFCPYDENILVGGAMNGSVVIWDITNKLKNVEEEEILTEAQQKYREYMFSLMKWMKNTKDVKVVRITAVSNLEYSHNGAITSIKWLPPTREITKSGQIKDIPETEDRTSVQFMTSGLDGTVLCWDIKIDPTATAVSAGRRKLRRLSRRPSGLVTESSTLNSFNRILKPSFKVNVAVPNKGRNFPLLKLNIRKCLSTYVEKFPDPNREYKLTDRIYFKRIFKRPDWPLQNEFLAATTEGNLIKSSWEGFPFNSGEAVNKETSKIDFVKKFHDGPILAITTSNLYPNIILTVGGRMFALWLIEALDRPTLWRKGQYRYKSGCWSAYRAHLFFLCRADGLMELWNLSVRSDRYQLSIPVSSGPLTGIYIHPFQLKNLIIGVGDYNGALRLFVVNYSKEEADITDVSSTYKFCVREAERKKKYDKWQNEWLERHKEWLEYKRECEQQIQNDKDEEAKKKNEQLEVGKELKVSNSKDKILLSKPEPGKFTEWAEAVWKINEERRMNRVLLGKKALNVELLERQQLPLIKITEEKKKKRIKQAQRLENVDKMFHNTVAVLFPEAVDKKPPPTLDAYGEGDPLTIKEEYYDNYLDIVKSSQEIINTNAFTFKFNWLKTMKDGFERRKLLDGYYSRSFVRCRKEEEILSMTSEASQDDEKSYESESSAQLDT